MKYESLSAELVERHSFSSSDIAFFISQFRERKIKKRQQIIQPDFQARHRVYIVEGAFKGYVLGKDGNERVVSLAIDNWWITDPNSYFYQQPATMFVEALEDSSILQLDFEREQFLKSYSPIYETYFRVAAERGVAFKHRRLIASLTLTAEERYEQFAKRYPAFLQRIPQYTIASYLGMTTQYLSRIRKQYTSIR
ncbi:MAG: Crp/Fnr family transcriptional regulator [Flammeovirgaceae bacterium]|nr:Crp/Fnr family transcriptional regulator [Flammeovirgaceae bacterium]|tara:strand:+ start:1796 stop:2380 length:585 start_codon:yes stop_codon:yes gene_type:complete